MSPAKLKRDHQSAKQVVIEHIQRYRMTVLPALMRLAGLKHLGRKRLKSLLRGLCQSGDLGYATLFHHLRYYFLARDELSKSQATSTKRRSGPLSEPAKIRNYATLAFCCLTDTYRLRLTATELQAQFPAISRPGLPLNYYVETSRDSPRLGFLRVDSCGRGRWDRIADRWGDDLQSHRLHPGFQEFIQQGRFEITLITALTYKAERLRELILKRHGESAKLLRIAVFPELLNLVAPPPMKT